MDKRLSIVLAFVILILLNSCAGPPQNRRTRNSSGGDRAVRIEKLIKEGTTLLRSGDCTAALARFDSVLSLDPNNTAVLLKKGSCLLILKRWEPLREIAGKVLDIDQENVEALKLRSAAYFNLGRKKEYLQDLEKAGKLSPLSFNTKMDLGRAYRVTGNSKKAIECYKRALKLAKTDAHRSSALLALGMTYKQRVDYPPAKKYFRRVIDLDASKEDKAYSWFALFDIHVDLQHDLYKGIKAYENYKKLDPDGKIVRYGDREVEAIQYRHLAGIYYWLADFKKAEEYHKKAMRLFPDFKGSYIELAETYYMMGNVKKARKYVRKWLSLNPDPPDNSIACQYYAFGYMILGDTKKARGYINKALDREPKDINNIGVKALIEFVDDNEDALRREISLYRRLAPEPEKGYAARILKTMERNKKKDDVNY